MQKKIPLLAAAFAPFLIMVIICIDHEVWPFGEQCILHIDMYHQYCPFFAEMAEKLQTGGSPFYSWKIGLGADFVSLYAYYLASPLNWLLLFCPRGAVIEFMTLAVLVKTAFAGFSFAYFLRAHFKTDAWQTARGDLAYGAAVDFGTAAFGTAYALSAFMAAYAWNIMWLDVVALAPLAVAGLERMVREGRPLLYYGVLSLCILSNYYISIMLCLFLALWFLGYWPAHRKSGITAWIRFAGYSLLAGGTGAVLIIPTAVVLSVSGASGISFPEKMEWYFGLIPELSRHLMLTEVYTGDEHWPNIYCGLFVLVLFVLYLLNNGISWRRKWKILLLASLFAVSFANNYLDFIWHGLHFPTSLPGRQAFLYSFVLLYAAFEELIHLREHSLWHLPAAAAVISIALTAFWLSETPAERNLTAYAVSAVFFSIYLVSAGICMAGKEKTRELMLAAGCFAVMAELVINYGATGLETVSRTSYLANLADYREVLARGEELAAEDGVMFYRTEELERRTKNDAAFYGYRSATQFSSLMNLEVSHFYQKLGMEGGKNFYSISGATPMLSAMLGIRYALADNDMEEGPLAPPVASSGGTYLYENTYVLPPGFVVDETVADAWDALENDDIGNQNDLAWMLGAQEQMLVPVSAVSNPGCSRLEVEETGYYYASYSSTDVDSLTMETSDGRSRSYGKVSHGYTLDLGYCKAGTVVEVKNTVEKTVSMTFYRLSLPALEQVYRTLSAQTLQTESVSDNRLNGVIRVRESGRLVFSIADEEGWRLYVDGEETEPEAFGGAFLSVHVEPGEHEIALIYESPGFDTGAKISAGCLLLAAFTLVLRKRREGLQSRRITAD